MSVTSISSSASVPSGQTVLSVDYEKVLAEKVLADHDKVLAEKVLAK